VDELTGPEKLWIDIHQPYDSWLRDGYQVNPPTSIKSLISLLQYQIGAKRRSSKYDTTADGWSHCLESPYPNSSRGNMTQSMRIQSRDIPHIS
jgi:hypothetical protein